MRSAAAARIDKLRKHELAIVVQDARGKAVVGAEVVVHQTKQAFGFGSAVVAQTLTRPGNERYKQLTAELFNTAVFENNLKWQPLAGDWGEGWTVEAALQGADWLDQHGIQARGHVLVWPGWKNLPRSLKALEKQPEKLRAAVSAHVTELATAMRGRLLHWDVLNEPFETRLDGLLGEDVMGEWFRAGVRRTLGEALINDYASCRRPRQYPHRDTTSGSSALARKGAPLDGIGIQGHFGRADWPEDLLGLLDRYANW